MRRQRLRMVMKWWGEVIRKSHRLALPSLILLLAASEAVWVVLLKFEAVNGARAVSGLIIIGVILFLAWRDDGSAASFASYAAPALGALVVFSPAVMPWYVIWALPSAIIARFRVWDYFSVLVCAAFQVMVDETERGWVLWLEYGLFALLCVTEMFRAIRKRMQDTSSAPLRRRIFGGPVRLAQASNLNKQSLLEEEK